MALGISERLLQRALAPIDLSYAYKKAELLSKQIGDEERLAKKEAAKQYQTDLAALNKDRIGVRSVDTPEVSKMYKEWADNERKLANNPNLITKSPELYGQLKSKSDEIYGKLSTMIKGSKELGKQEIEHFQELSNPKNFDYYKEGAASIYKNSVMNRPWSEVVKTGANDITKLFEDKINASPFYKDLGTKVIGQATEPHKVKDETFKGAPGEERFIEFKKMPSLRSLPAVVSENLFASMGNKSTKFAAQQVGELIKTGEYDNVKKAYNDFFRDDNPEGYKKYYDTPQPKLNLFEGDLTPTQMFINHTVAKEFLSRLPNGVLGKPEWESASAEARYKESIKKKTGEGTGAPGAEPIDLWTPSVEKIKSVTSQPRFAGKNVTVESFDPMMQQIAINKARDVSGDPSLRPSDLALNYDENSNIMNIYARNKIEVPGKKPINPGERIFAMSEVDVNRQTNQPYGQKMNIAGLREIQQQRKRVTPKQGATRNWADKYLTK